MTKHVPAKVTACPKCGREMERGQRVRVGFGWERPTTYRRHDGSEVEAFDQTNSSRFMCRECAARLSREAGVPVPEVVA